ncbi:MAG: hypothetical protein CR972_04460 [Candidatus Moraniibacteriota bacterium]|nr:MAG: hypothetical protein CR972_04460 [Candidatus Moranbacteria bacterium]
MGYIRGIQEKIQQRPFVFFMILVVICVIIFVIGRRAFVVEYKNVTHDDAPKVVTTFQIDRPVYTELSGKVTKDGVVTVVSHVGGIIHKVYVDNGSTVRFGQKIAYISDTYTGANRADVAYQISQEHVTNSDETYAKKMSIIDDKRDDVNKTDSLTSEIARKQYTIQKRDMELSREVTLLQKKNAAIAASLYRPKSPFSGVVDYVFVSRGDTVHPGDKIVTINAQEKIVTISVHISTALAAMIDVSQPSVITVEDQKIELLPTHLSEDVADDQSYVLTFTVPEEYSDVFNHNEYVSLSVPVQVMSEGNNGVLLPVDAVRLMNNKSVIFIAVGDTAHAMEVTRGKVVGSFIFVQGDVSRDMRVIVDRNVYDGDHIVCDDK